MPRVPLYGIAMSDLVTRNSGGCQNEMCFQRGVAWAVHERAQENGFKVAAVISQMRMRLTKGRDDLRHLETEDAVLIGQGRAMAVGIAFMAFGCMGPDLDALTCQRRAVTGPSDGA